MNSDYLYNLFCKPRSFIPRLTTSEFLQLTLPRLFNLLNDYIKTDEKEQPEYTGIGTSQAGFAEEQRKYREEHPEISRE